MLLDANTNLQKCDIKFIITWKFSTAVPIFFANKLRTALKSHQFQYSEYVYYSFKMNSHQEKGVEDHYSSKSDGSSPRKSSPTQPSPIAQYCCRKKRWKGKNKQADILVFLLIWMMQAKVALSNFKQFIFLGEKRDIFCSIKISFSCNSNASYRLHATHIKAEKIWIVSFGSIYL